MQNSFHSGLRRPSSDSSGAEGPSGSEKNSFSWNVPKILERLQWVKERSLCSADVKVGNLSSVTLEFYPGGVEASWPGYCAMRIHVPDRTRLTWGIFAGVGPTRHSCGQRTDEFASHHWWCKKGVLWPNLCKVEDLRRQIARESNSLCITFTALQVSTIEKPQQTCSRTNSLPRPMTAGGMGFGRRNLEEHTALRSFAKSQFDKRHVQILYKRENLTNPWLAEFVVNWLQSRSAKEGGALLARGNSVTVLPRPVTAGGAM